MPPCPFHIPRLRRPPSRNNPQPGIRRVQPQRARRDPPPALARFGVRRKLQVGVPQRDGARVLEHGALEDAEGAGVAGVRGEGGGGRRVEVQAAGALGAQPVEGAFPGDVGEEVGWFGAWGEDLVFVVGAFGYEGADLVL